MKKRPNTSSTMKHFTKEEKRKAEMTPIVRKLNPEMQELGKELGEAGDIMVKIMKKFIQEQNMMISKSILLNAQPPIEGNITPRDLIERNIQMKHSGDQMWLEQRGERISPIMVSTINQRNEKITTPKQ